MLKQQPWCLGEQRKLTTFGLRKKKPIKDSHKRETLPRRIKERGVGLGDLAWKSWVSLSEERNEHSQSHAWPRDFHGKAIFPVLCISLPPSPLNKPAGSSNCSPFLMSFGNLHCGSWGCWSCLVSVPSWLRKMLLHIELLLLYHCGLLHPTHTAYVLIKDWVQSIICVCYFPSIMVIVCQLIWRPSSHMMKGSIHIKTKNYALQNKVPRTATSDTAKSWTWKRGGGGNM